MEALLCNALNNAAVAALLAAGAAAVTRRCRGPAVRHALWLLVLLKLVTPPLVALPLAWPRGAGTEVPTPELSPAPAAVAPPEQLRESPPPLAAPADPATVPDADPAPVRPRLADVGVPLAVGVWLAGSLGWWGLAGVRLARFGRLLRQARPAPPEVQAQARRLAGLLGLRRCPPVAFVAAPLSPMLWALGFSPRVLLPAALWQALNERQQDTLLAHELAHLRRGDHWVRRLEFVVLGLYWWHPVAWWARRRLQEAEEECCDALVVAALPGAAPAYAAALVETVAFLSQARAASPVGSSGAGHVPLLKRRLTMILTNDSSRRPPRAAFWAVLGLGALLLPLAPGAARTESPGCPDEGPGRGFVDCDADGNIEIGELHKFRDGLKHGLHGQDWKEIKHFLNGDQQFCARCHAVAARDPKELQARPQSWREAHDEVVRLMAEVRARQAQLREAEKSLELVLRRLDTLKPAERAQEYITTHSVLHGSAIHERIEIKNPGNRPLRIAAVRSSSGGLTARAERMEIPPGGQTTVHVHIDTGRFTGEKTLTVTIQFEDNRRPEQRWHFRVFSVAPRLPPLPRAADGEKKTRLNELENKVESLLKEVHDLRREMQTDTPRDPGRGQEASPDEAIWRRLGVRLKAVGAESIRRNHPEFRGGLRVTEVRPNSPAANACLTPDDVLVGLHKFEMLEGKHVLSALDHPDTVARKQVKFYILRNDRLQVGEIFLR